MADKKNDKYLSLYPEDFLKRRIWREVCDVLDIRTDVAEVKIYFTEDDVVEVSK